MKISKSRLLALFAISVILNTIALLGYTYPRLINKFQQYTSQRQHTLQTANDTTLYINGQSLAVYGKYHNENVTTQVSFATLTAPAAAHS